MRIIIVSPSLNAKLNVSGISSVTEFIINKNIGSDYSHFPIGKIDKEKRSLFWLIKIMVAYVKWFFMMIYFKEEIIHFNLALTTRSILRDFPLILCSRIFRRKLILHIHGGDFVHKKPKQKMIDFIIRIIFSGKNPTIVLAFQEKRNLEFFYNCKNLHVLPNCIDLDEARINASSFSNNETLTFLFLGRIIIEKGIEYIYYALEELKNSGYKFKFMLAGSGPVEIEFVEKFKLLLGDDFEFVGVVSGETKVDLFKKCQIFLFPTFFPEGLPVALLESMAFGLVPITTNAGAIENVVKNGINGIIVSKHSSKEIGNSIRYLIENRSSLEKFSENAKKFIFENFDPVEYISKLNGIYDLTEV
jgi:glycosyltransferase involved in cell wall biosynthesis